MEVKLPEHIQRMHIELAELEERINKGEAYIVHQESKNLPVPYRLPDQIHVMKLYMIILKDRIEHETRKYESVNGKLNDKIEDKITMVDFAAVLNDINKGSIRIQTLRNIFGKNFVETHKINVKWHNGVFRIFKGDELIPANHFLIKNFDNCEIISQEDFIKNLENAKTRI